MFDDEISRREAMEKLLAMVALAAGVGVADSKLFAQAVRKANPVALKFLKLRLSGLDRQVFTSEFGRSRPLVPAAQVKISKSVAGLSTAKTKAAIQTRPGQAVQPGSVSGAMGCQVNFPGAGGPGAAGAAPCPTFAACGMFSDDGGSGCPGFSLCGDNICNGQDAGGDGGMCTGVNDCNGQDCGDLNTCGDNECTSQNCPNLSGCGINKRDIVGLIEQFRNDPYIQGLMQQLHTTNVNNLAAQVESMIRDRRTITITPTKIR